MKIDRFQIERTQCLYENEVEFNLSESGVLPLSPGELLPDPGSQSGAVLTETEMDAIVAAADRVGAWIMADEIYRGAELDGPLSPT